MDNLYQPPTDEENILDGMGLELVQASSGVRFSNLLVDRLVFYLLWRFGLAKIMIAGIEYFNIIIEDRIFFILMVWLFAATFNVFLLTILESATGGKSIGKLFTGSRAVNSDGTRIGLRKAFLRSLSRLVPFEVFSGLGSPCYPWHDRWTGTLVIDERSSHMPG